MAAFFTIGESKVRPGVYIRYENYGTPAVVGAADGVCAAVVRSNWGPMGGVVYLEGVGGIANAFGGAGVGFTAALLEEMFKGGARYVYAVRLGSGGAKGKIELKDGADAAALTLELLYPGSRQFQIVIRDSIDGISKELLLLENTTLLQRLSFAKGGDEVAALLAAYTNAGSDWFTLAGNGTGELAALAQTEIPPGTDPAITTESYESAFVALEPYRFNCIALDTNDVVAQTLLHTHINRVYEDGKLVMGVVGEPTDVPFDMRVQHAREFNDYKIVYVGSGFKDKTGAAYEGYLAAARVAGMIAGTPSNQSITHMELTGATELTEVLTSTQYVKATSNGMLTFSVSASGVNWIESGANTLVAEGVNDDAGWKKIKRVKVRFELMQRISDSVEALVGSVNNDSDGRATIIQSAQGVCNAMVAEKKVLPGAAVGLDEINPPEGDSAWFVVNADDIDALEKMYFAFKFRFAPEE